MTKDPQSIGNDEPRWHASLGVLAILGLYITLPPKVTFGPLWLFPLLVLAILVPLSVISPIRRHENAAQRIASIGLIALLNLFNILSLVLLIASIVHRAGVTHFSTGAPLLLAGVQIWLTNTLVFALWYWELDSGGPEARAHAISAQKFSRADFLFPQMASQNDLECVDPGWKPLFIDYLFLAFTNSTAFSPADTFPLTRLGKVLMMAEAFVSFTTIGIIISRAVGILA
ncbi:MAG: hypothetical protein DLM50_09135 [Candidatus Meridianibacter frigidus]|nr:MAG: hypothetical protein DLM50_09135 [Candidatus Eremiobacteraeota bacterium]